MERVGVFVPFAVWHFALFSRAGDGVFHTTVPAHDRWHWGHCPLTCLFLKQLAEVSELQLESKHTDGFCVDSRSKNYTQRRADPETL